MQKSTKTLRKLLHNNNLYTRGDKAQLIERLNIYNSSPDLPHYSIRTITHLKQLLSYRGLSTLGHKDVLISRLEEDDNTREKRIKKRNRKIRRNGSANFLTGLVDVDRYILMFLDYKDLCGASMTNQYTYTTVCNDSYWGDKLYEQFNSKSGERVLNNGVILTNKTRWEILTLLTSARAILKGIRC